MEQESTNRRLFLQLIAGFAVVIGVVLFLPIFGSVSVKGQQTKSLSNVKQVATACRLYALDHGGNFPAHLGELEPDYLPNLNELRAAVFVNPNKDSGLRIDWLYFGAGFTEENPPTLLLTSPQAFDRKDRKNRIRIFAFSDTSCRIGPESEYQSTLAKTMQETQTLLERIEEIAVPSATPAHNR